jgi:hypothetical protein
MGAVAGQRSGGLWGSYSLGEAADAVWRVADEVGSAVEATSVHVHMPASPTDFPRVEVIVAEPLDARLVYERLGMEELPGMLGVDVVSCVIDQTLLTIRVAQES